MNNTFVREARMRPSLLLFMILAALSVQGQIAHGGRPVGWGQPLPHPVDIARVDLPALDRAVLIQAEEDSAMPGIRYGVQRFVAIDVLASGTWHTTTDDRRVCRVVIRSPGAVMLSVQFGAFQLAPGARIYLHDSARDFFLGGFTGANVQPDGTLATAVVPGDEVVIEYVEPLAAQGTSVVEVASITHGYRDIFDFGAQGLLRDYDPGYQSAPCHNNVVCPVAAGWDQQVSATVMFLRPDGNGCTGSLVNSTAQPSTPYFYFANHCYTPTESQWVFYFNYESPTCVGTIGPTTETLTGGTLKAAYYYDDLALLQLNNAPPLGYAPYYAGWDRSGNTPATTTLVHHPNYDVKKITFDYGPATSYVDGVGTAMWGSTWDSGVVQAVSSGAPCFDQNKRIIGHMNGGAYSCTVPSENIGGAAKFSASWDGASPSTRLRDWLDPANTTVALDGYDPANTPLPTLPVRLKVFLQGPYDAQNLNMGGALRANGMVPLTEPYSALGYGHVGGGGETTTPAVLASTGSASVVDWVVVELRDKNDAANVVATRSALLLRNGSVVGVNGSSDVLFQSAADDYYIAVRHRNHLGIMTQDPQPLGLTPLLRDLTNGSVPLNGGSLATNNVNGVRVMVPGDVTRNGQVKYAGSGNDRDPILTRVGGTVPTATASGYLPEDLNMDGSVKYAGSSNDRDVILTVIGGTTPTATRSAQIP